MYRRPRDNKPARSACRVPCRPRSRRSEGFDGSEDDTGRGTPIVPVYCPEVADTLTAYWERSKGAKGGNSVGLLNPIIEAPVCFDTTQITCRDNRCNPQPGDPSHPLAASAHPPAVAFDLRGREGGAQFEGPHDTANIRAASGGSSRSYIAERWAVRRLTPRECERLQGISDDWTAIETRGKPAADGPRYAAIGNSWAVEVFAWVGRRLDAALRKADAS